MLNMLSDGSARGKWMRQHGLQLQGLQLKTLRTLLPPPPTYVANLSWRVLELHPFRMRSLYASG
jgi:hypothetical protein